MNKNGVYIAASSNSIPDYCNPNNVKVMFEEIERCACGENHEHIENRLLPIPSDGERLHFGKPSNHVRQRNGRSEP